jgi:uncharacterized protein YndB with AHSA1/START domain
MVDTETLKVTTPSDLEIEMTRVFHAPRRLVFDAHIKPELLKRWLLGPDGWEMVVCTAATKVGERYRYEWRNAAERQFGIGGVCQEFHAPDKLVALESMDGFPGEALVTTTFVEEEGKTTLTTRVRYPSKEVRDAAINSGMAGGVSASYDRLARILAE